MMRSILKIIIMFFTIVVSGTEYHVSKTGNDTNKGSVESPFLTIQAAANIALAGDVVIVHKGIYRERIDPKNGGLNNLNRIVYRAAENEKVVIKGSEVITGWKKVKNSVWKAAVSNDIFKNKNPFSTVLEGDWFISERIKHHTGEVFLNGKSLFEENSLEEVMNPKVCEWSVDKESSLLAWYAKVDKENTTIWANFQGANPNKELIEINAREACFYPSQVGINYITISGFEMDQAATQWAAPTAEQPGLIGTHWSKGWIIENNSISNSKSVGISLGKDRSSGHNVWMQNKKKDGATHYNEVVLAALDGGWSKENIGSHIVRNNVIFDCGQAGVVGSLGCAFSTISNNHIYNIYTKRSYTGMEMAGIKLHAAIDVIIEKNRIHNTHCGIWLDWMAQGAHITRNIIYDNDQYDFHDEVNHGPMLVDHNLFLSEEGISTISRSEGAAFAHNMFAGRSKNFPITMRSTPYHWPHSTKLKGLKNIKGGDNRFYNNIFIALKGKVDLSANRQRPKDETVDYGLNGYNSRKDKSFAEGNIFYNGAKPYLKEKNSMVVDNFKPTVEVIEKGKDLVIRLNFDDSLNKVKTNVVSTKRLGTTIVSEATYEKSDGTSFILNTDFFGNKRNITQPIPGPFENIKEGVTEIKFIQNLSSLNK